METSDKFPLALEHDKKLILEILDSINVIQMYNLLNYLNEINGRRFDISQKTNIGSGLLLIKNKKK
jgi:hypothetical protein